LVEEETWFNAQEALDAGLVDSIGEKVEATNFAGLNFKEFKHLPGEIINYVSGNPNPPPDPNLPLNSTEAEEKEMTPEEIQKLVADSVAAAVTPLQTQLTATESKLTDATNQLKEASNRSTDNSKTLISNRINRLVASEQVLPQERDMFLSISDSLAPEKIEEYLANLEKRPKITKGALTTEVTNTSGQRQTVEIHRMFTNPVGTNGDLVGPNPQAYALFNEIAAGCKNHEELRKKIYAHMGENYSPISEPDWLTAEVPQV
jgi:hypothetical protein